MMASSLRRALPWLALSSRFLKPPVPVQPLRNHYPIAGPPRFPMSGGQKLLIGGGSLLLMMIIPFWALFSIPRWSALHRGVEFETECKKKEEDEEPTEEKEKK